MPPTTSYDFGDIVLVPFPFTDQTGAKKRPAVVVSASSLNAQRPDIVIMAITSRTGAGPAEVPVTRWREAGLLSPSVCKPVFATLERSLVVRRLGKLASEDLATLHNALRNFLG